MESSKVFIHEKALVESKDIGENARIWAFVHILKGARIGRNCNIGDHCFIESDVEIGDNVVIKNGTSIWNRVRIGDNVFVGPTATFINDPYPRSKVYRDEYIPAFIERGASIGANATILCGVTIGEYAMVGAGSVVTKDAPNFALVYGNPARIRGYVCVCGEKLRFNELKAECHCGERYVLDGDRVVRAGGK